MYTITIKYTKPVADTVLAKLLYPIAPEFTLGKSYVDARTADNKHRLVDTSDKGAFSGNDWDNGTFEMAESLEAYLGKLSEHPGVTLALKSAVFKKGQAYEISTEDYKDAMYYEDLGRKLKDDGFEITVKASQAAAG